MRHSVVARSLLSLGVLVACGDDSVSGVGSSGEATEHDDMTAATSGPDVPSSTSDDETSTDETSTDDTSIDDTSTDDTTSEPDTTSTGSTTESTGTPSECGNGIVERDEACDDGRDNASDGACLPACLQAECGDGFVWAGVEQCDDGNLLDTDACPTTCIPAVCGDGFTRAGVEQCDDGNLVDTDACPTTCISALCGDGLVFDGTEECDDANDENSDGCETDCTWTCPLDGQVIYVDADAVGAEDGSSWADAYTSVFVATQNAEPGDEIWIAEGNYPSVAANAPVAVLQTCVDIYGGFAGTEAAIDERPSPLLETILQGDFQGNDGAGGFGDNAYQVVVAMDVVPARIDGVTVSNGRAVLGADFGGGLYVVGSTLTLVDVTASNNASYDDGAGLHATQSNLTLIRPRFTGNTQLAGSPVNALGGGMHTYQCALVLDEPTFENNATSSGGGGISSWFGTLEITGGLFEGNSAGDGNGGGGAINVYEGTAAITGTDFTANAALDGGAIAIRGDNASLAMNGGVLTGNAAIEEGGALRLGPGDSVIHPNFPASLDSVQFAANTAIWGGAIYGSGIDLVLTDATFEDNTADIDGGGIYAFYGDITATGSTFHNNQANGANWTDGGGAIRGAPVDLEATNCLFVGNGAEQGGAVLIEESSGNLGTADFTDTTFTNNMANADGGAVFLSRMAATTTGGLFENNSAGRLGGAVHQWVEGSHAFDGVEFIGNTAANGGGALRLGNGLEATLTSALFDGNSAENGGAVSTSVDTEIRSTAFLDNTATVDGGAVSSTGVVDIRDSTFTGNQAARNGGAISVVTDTMLLGSCTFELNSATFDGGAVYSDDGYVTVLDSAFSTCEANAGAAIYARKTSSSTYPRVHSSSFFDNAGAEGAGGVEIVDSTGSEGLVVNTAFWGNTGNDIVGAVHLDVTYTCSEDFLSLGDGNVFGIDNPFVVGSSGELFLAQDSECHDGGHDATATADYGVLGSSWDMMTTDPLGALDDSPVDMGVHYPP